MLGQASQELSQPGSESQKVWKKCVVVGAGGPVGRSLLDALVAAHKSETIVATSRSGELEDMPAGVEVAKIDLTTPGAGAELAAMCDGADVCFSTVGLKYDGRVWEKTWPVVCEALIEGAKGSGARLVVMDSLYCFGPEGMDRMPLRENDTEYTTMASKRKPFARAQIARRFMQAHEKGEAKVTLVRSSDFFGERVLVSMLGMVWDEMVVSGKAPNLIGDPSTLHSMTYIKDVANALVAVASDPTAFGRPWHVPCAEPITMLDWVSKILECNDKHYKPKYMRVDGALLWFLSWFVSPLAELKEMAYAFQADYVVDSREFNAKFPDVKATPIDVAVKATNDFFLQLKKDKEEEVEAHKHKK